MTLVRWDPFGGLFNVQRGLDRLFSDVSPPGGDDTYGTWVPAVDIFERGDDLVLRAEIPGVDKQDLDIRVEDGTLFISGERKRDEELREDTAYRLERTYGKFSRSFRLPKTVNAGRIEARYANGVLEITLPKLEAAKPRQVKIHAA